MYSSSFLPTFLKKEVNYMLTTISKNELMTVGYSEYTASCIIRKAKIHLVNQGFQFYENKRLGRVPKQAIQEIIGFDPFEKNYPK